MRARKLLGSRWLTATLLATLIIALPAMPAAAVPCDAYRFDTTSLPRHEVPVVVATDEAWQQASDASADATARQLIADVNAILQPTGVRLVIADHVAWMSRASDLSMSGALEHLDS